MVADYEIRVVSEKETAVEVLKAEVRGLFEKGGIVGNTEFLRVETPAHNFAHVEQVLTAVNEAAEVLITDFDNLVTSDPNLIKNLIREQRREEVSEKDLEKIQWTNEDREILKAAVLLHDIGVLRTSEDQEEDARKFYPLHVIRSEEKAELILRTLFPNAFNAQDIERVKKLISFTDHSNKKRLKEIPFGTGSQQLKDEILGNLLRQTDEFVYTADPDMVRTQSALYWEFLTPLPKEALKETLGDEVVGSLGKITTWYEAVIGPEKALNRFLTSDWFSLERVLKEHRGLLGLLDRKYQAEQTQNPYLERFLKNLRDRYELLTIWDNPNKIEAHRHLEGTIDADDIVALGEELRTRNFKVEVPKRHEIERTMLREPLPGEHPVIPRLATRYLKEIVDQLDEVDEEEKEVFFEMLGEVATNKILTENVQGGKLEIAPFAYVKTADEAKRVLISFRNGMDKALGNTDKKIELFATLRRDREELVGPENEGQKLVNARHDEDLAGVIAGFSLAGPEEPNFPLVNYQQLIEPTLVDTQWEIHIGETADMSIAQRNFENLLSFLGQQAKGISLINPVALLDSPKIAEQIKSRQEVIVLSLNPLGKQIEDPQEKFEEFLRQNFNFLIGADDPNVFGHYASLSLVTEYWIAIKALWNLRDVSRSKETLSTVESFTDLKELVFDEQGGKKEEFTTRLKNEATTRVAAALPQFLPPTST